MSEFPLPRLGLALASLVVVGCVAGYATLQNNASPRRAQQAVAQLDTAMADAVFSEDFDWWIQNAGVATGMFHCSPIADKDAGGSVVVWTGRANNIVAFGAAQEGTQLPAYLAVLGRAATIDASQAVHVAKEGHVVLAAGKKHVLHLKDMKLACERTWDD